jgi:hypothetical protein
MNFRNLCVSREDICEAKIVIKEWIVDLPGKNLKLSDFIAVKKLTSDKG